jgi:peptide/nickel transport system substrate-binding protein
MPARRFLLWSAMLSICGCRGEYAAVSEKVDGGTIVIAATSDPNTLFPPAPSNLDAHQVQELIFEYLADVGPGLNTIGDSAFVKELASGWTWSVDSTSIAFHINPRAVWQDGPRVTSNDVAFSFSLYRDEKVSPTTTSSLTNIDSVSTPNDSTAVFWFNHRTPHQFYEAAAQMLIIPEHVFASVARDSLEEFAADRQPVGSGKFRLVKWDPASRLELGAVEGHYRGRANADRIIRTITPEYQSAVTQLLAGVADVFPNIRRESVGPLTSGGKFNIVSLPGMDYVFLQLNLRNRLFASRDLRRALTMALDRHAMVTNLFDTLAAVAIGPTVRAYPTTDTALAQIPYDTAGAARILDSLGWKRPAPNKTRERNGVPLRFTTLVPSSSPSRVRIASLIQEQLRQAGIEMRTEQMDFQAFQQRQLRRDFDVSVGGWHMNSAPGMIRDTWTTRAGGKDGSNYGGYSNPVFDAYVDSALSASTIPASRAWFKRAHQIIIDDAPGVWLYEPRTEVAVQNRIETTPMRPNSWWLDVANWTITPSKRIDRDRITRPNQ